MISITIASVFLQAQSPNPLPQFMLIIGIFIIMYFFMIRPQTKKAKAQKEFIEGLQKGDKVVTIGGLHGKIVKVNDTTFTLEVAPNIRFKVEKSVVSLDFTGKDTNATQEVTSEAKT